MKTIFNNHKNLIPLILIFVITLRTYFYLFFYYEIQVNGSISKFVPTIPHLLSPLFIILNTVVYFKFRKYFKQTIIFSLVLAMLGLFQFTLENITLMLPIPLELFPFLICILYLLFNFERFKIKPRQTEDFIPDNNKIDDFLMKFGDKTNEELEEIIQDKRYVVESKLAAEKILNTRNNIKND